MLTDLIKSTYVLVGLLGSVASILALVSVILAARGYSVAKQLDWVASKFDFLRQRSAPPPSAQNAEASQAGATPERLSPSEVTTADMAVSGLVHSIRSGETQIIRAGAVFGIGPSSLVGSISLLIGLFSGEAGSFFAGLFLGIVGFIGIMALSIFVSKMLMSGGMNDDLWFFIAGSFDAKSWIRLKDLVESDRFLWETTYLADANPDETIIQGKEDWELIEDVSLFEDHPMNKLVAEKLSLDPISFPIADGI